ncbi:unnamed protein product, partial [Ectocarpus sp. 6 AP-2014]
LQRSRLTLSTRKHQPYLSFTPTARTTETHSIRIPGTTICQVHLHLLQLNSERRLHGGKQGTKNGIQGKGNRK